MDYVNRALGALALHNFYLLSNAKSARVAIVSHFYIRSAVNHWTRVACTVRVSFPFAYEIIMKNSRFDFHFYSDAKKRPFFFFGLNVNNTTKLLCHFFYTFSHFLRHNLCARALIKWGGNWWHKKCHSKNERPTTIWKWYFKVKGAMGKKPQHERGLWVDERERETDTGG